MLKGNVKAEEEAIRLYKEAIQVASKEGDFTTKRLLEEIFSQEKKHLDARFLKAVGIPAFHATIT